MVGTFAHLPRYFADANRVMDLDSRIVWCARELQEVAAENLLEPRAADGGLSSAIDDMAAYVASLSVSWRISPPAAHAKERQAHEIGRTVYGRRQGPLDFSCATCHGGADTVGADGPAAIRVQSIRVWQGQPLPQLGQPAEARTVVGAWPAWRASEGGVRTLQGRLAACFRHMGVAPPAMDSEVMVGLVAYLLRLGEGGEVLAPGRRQ